MAVLVSYCSLPKELGGPIYRTRASEFNRISSAEAFGSSVSGLRIHKGVALDLRVKWRRAGLRRTCWCMVGEFGEFLACGLVCALVVLGLGVYDVVHTWSLRSA